MNLEELKNKEEIDENEINTLKYLNNKTMWDFKKMNKSSIKD
jgi:hypothetical protein